jgi:glycosyltransferase involved in cell wall biosynthesis
VRADVESLDPFLSQAWLAVAPMAAGSGVPMKVLEAWAAGVPVVARRWAAEGLDASCRSALEEADDAPSFAEATTGLLESPDRRGELAAAGKQAWRRCYHPDVVAEQIRQAVAACLR